MRRNVLAAVLVLAAGAAWWARPARASVNYGGALESFAAEADYFVEDIMSGLTPGAWTPPERAAPYLPAIYAAEDANGIPRNLLARLIYAESRYREDIISGAVKSSAGALGIAQFMPATAADLGVDPLDPWAAIDAAARYLAQLKRSAGSWRGALAAYNWGIGNVQRKGLDAAPAETRGYVAGILGDVPNVA